jgi:outer membrane protein assembly factor BamE (lipoprotein component of BamABCDE complex)
MRRRAFLMALLLPVALSGCATLNRLSLPQDEFPQGEVTDAPLGHLIHCALYPESVFCP